ncbi:MAG: 30S ribosomal protein S6 [Polyangiaceae bacterium]|nr:30S ribosomal protein S6 [Polyangiaceae bacterium]
MVTEQSAKMPAREYETIYILKSDTSKEGASKVAERVGDVVGKEGGKLTLVETWGRRQLAYPVKKQRRGVYVYVKYLGGGGVVSELERNLRMLDEVVKYQTVQVREGVDEATVQVDPEAITFADVEPPGEDDVDETLEQSLGLVDGPSRRHDVEEEGGDMGLGDEEDES